MGIWLCASRVRMKVPEKENTSPSPCGVGRAFWRGCVSIILVESGFHLYHCSAFCRFSQLGHMVVGFGSNNHLYSSWIHCCQALQGIKEKHFIIFHLLTCGHHQAAVGVASPHVVWLCFVVTPNHNAEKFNSIGSFFNFKIRTEVLLWGTCTYIMHLKTETMRVHRLWRPSWPEQVSSLRLSAPLLFKHYASGCWSLRQQKYSKMSR